MSQIDRRRLLGAGLVTALWPALLPLGARADTLSHSTLPVAPFVEVETATGRLRGGTERGALAFKSIPYAGSVSGRNRFKAAPKATPWTGVFDATKLGAPAPQTEGSTYGEQEPARSEDCLVLNVWTPATSGRRPVMLYLHGGGYSTGSGGSPTQDGARLAAVYDVVVVACNHRLGLLGYLYLGDHLGEDYSGNAGMQDAVTTLEWIRDNIAAFGGDPGNVTVFGESGGGAKTGTLLGMPSATGLYHKAGIQSGAALYRMPKEAAAETTRRLMKALDITDARKLFDVPAETLLKLQWAGEKGQGPLVIESDDGLMGRGFSNAIQPGHFGPVVDGHVLPKDPWNGAPTPLAAHIPLLIGSNREEAAFVNMGRPDTFSMDEAALNVRVTTEFGSAAGALIAAYRQDRPGASPSDIYIAIATARMFGNDTLTLAGLKAAQPAPVYAYRWDYRSNRPIKGSEAVLGAGHATDIGPTFYNWDQQGLHGDGPGVEAASRHLSAVWTSFARTGKPSADGVPDWPRYDARRRAVMIMDSTCTLIENPDPHAQKVWADV